VPSCYTNGFSFVSQYSTHYRPQFDPLWLLVSFYCLLCYSTRLGAIPLICNFADCIRAKRSAELTNRLSAHPSGLSDQVFFLSSVESFNQTSKVLQIHFKMVYSLNYRRPDPVPASRDQRSRGSEGSINSDVTRSSEDVAASMKSMPPNPKGIPEDLSFDRILNDGCCPVSVG
jgi:hypothetical protein